MPNPTQDLDDDLPGAEPTEKPEAKKPEAKRPAAPAPKPEPTPEPEQKKYQHTQRLVKLATDLGFSQDDLDNFPSDVIWEEIDRIRQQEAAQRRPEPTVEAKKPEAEQRDPDAEYVEKLAEVDPDLARLLKKRLLEDTRIAEINEKLKRLDQLEEFEKQRQSRRGNAMVDKAFAALGEAYEPLVGAGSINDLTDPGQKGWRGAIYQKANIQPADFESQAKINAKIAAAAKAVAGDRVAEAKEPANDYDSLAARRPQQRDGNGRFTAADFERGQLHRPNGKQTGIEQLNAVEATRRYLKEHGDPRGDRPSIEFDEDLPA